MKKMMNYLKMVQDTENKHGVKADDSNINNNSRITTTIPQKDNTQTEST